MQRELFKNCFPLMIAMLMLLGSLGNQYCSACLVQDDNPFGGVPVLQGNEPFNVPINMNLQRALFGQQQEDAVAEEDEKPEDEKAEDESDADVEDTSNAKPAPPVNPKLVRVHLWDGSIVSGEVAVENVQIETEFGVLSVPVEKIHSFSPGLASFPELNEKVENLVKQLGDGNFDVRQAAHREILNMGMMMRNEISKFDDGGSAERKKHLMEIQNEIAEMLDDIDEIEQSEDDKALIRGDSIVTENFTIVGKIQQDTFKVKTKFGALEIALADIRKGDRPVGGGIELVKKSISIPGKTFFQKNPKTTKIRVNKGDKIMISATGSIHWSNWGNIHAGPEGTSNQGQWRGHNCGTLMARIGSSNDNLVKIGTKKEFTAKKTGVLYLALAMQDSYANNNGYNWNGELKARVTVEPVSN